MFFNFDETQVVSTVCLSSFYPHFSNSEAKMLTCIARSKDKQLNDDSAVDQTEQSSNKIQLTKQNSVKSLASQFKDIAVKASGAYQHCNPCTGTTLAHQQEVKSKTIESESNVTAASERFRWSFRRTGSLNATTTAATAVGKPWGKEMEARLKGISSSDGTPRSVSGRRVVDPIVFVEEIEPKEWVAQVEPGVMITFVSVPRGGNDLKRIRFSQEMFNKWQAQKWWTQNYDRVMELYNVQRLDRHVFPLPTPPRSVDESSKLESADDTPITPPLTQERLRRNLNRPTGLGKGYSSSDSMEQHSMQSLHHRDSGLTSTPKLSSISGVKTETSSLDTSIRTSSSRDVDRSGELSTSNASEMEAEWVEEDEPGVYITIRAMPNGPRELRRVRFSREKFGEVHARLWWEENRKRIREQYLS